MGLTNAPRSFQRIMTNVLSDLTRTCVKVYLDDIIIHSRTEEEHVEHLRLVLARLQVPSVHQVAEMQVSVAPRNFLRL